MNQPTTGSRKAQASTMPPRSTRRHGWASSTGDGNPATQVPLGTLGGITVDPSGSVYFSEIYNHRVRKVDTKGVITTVAGGLVNQQDMMDTLKRSAIAGAGLDVTDPEPLPESSPLWSMGNVAISPHLGGQSDGARDRQWRLFRENVRRFVAGEPLLGVVDKSKGY